MSEKKRRMKKHRKGNSDQKLIKHIMISCWNVISQLREKFNSFYCVSHAVLCKSNRDIYSDGSKDEWKKSQSTLVIT